MRETNLKTKSNIEFILKIASVFEGFQYRGKKYLPYIQTPRGGDEFLLRDNLIKPLFTDVFGYHKQKDFAPEERIRTGEPDIQIIDSTSRSVVVIETLSSGAKAQEFQEHRKRLFDYTDELGSKIAVLTNGIIFEAYWNRGRGKSKDRLVLLGFDQIYRKFAVYGIDGLAPSDWEGLLKLKYLSKELQLASPEEIYKEPELDISEETHFDRFLEQLQELMEQVKSDVKGQFEFFKSKYEEYQKLREQREKAGQPIYASEVKQYKLPKKCTESFKKWRGISPTNGTSEKFQLETMYIFFNRILLLRICEDKSIAKRRRISNGGIRDWMTFKGFTRFTEVNYNELLKDAYKMMGTTYPHLFREDIFDWYVPDNEVLLRVLFTFNPYNFKQVDRDVLGKLYERYIPLEERKHLGQFYTPEEVINYILEAVGYREDGNIEGKKLLDPACGSGGFLVRATNILIQRLKAKGCDPETILNKLQESIYGFEINPFACHLSETNLLFQVIDLINKAKQSNPDFEMGRFNIFETDSLRIPKEKAMRLFEEYNSYWLEDAQTVRQIKLKENGFKDGFDFVVGNPPYGDVLDSESKKTLSRKYPFVADYEISQYFTALGMDLLKDKGHLGYIVPNTVLLNVYANRFRQHLVDHCCIPQVVDLSEISVFLDPQVRNIILLLRMESVDKVRGGSEVEAFFCERVKEHSLVTKLQNRRKLLMFKDDDKQWLYLFRSKTDTTNIIVKIESDAEKLGKITQTSQGLIPYDKYRGHSPEIIKNRIWHANYKKDDTYRKELRGGDVKRYHLEWNGVRWISYGNWLAAPRKPEFFTSARILIREITDEATGKVNATFTDEEYYNNPSIINIINKPGKEYDLKYILAVINSTLFAFYHLHTSPKAKKGLFPKILVKDVRDIPIKAASPIAQKEFVDLVEEILEINKNLPALEAKATNIQKLLKDFDFSLGDLAGIPGITFEIEERIGKPRIRREQLKVYLDSKSYIECKNGNQPTYIELYLKSLGDNLRGKTTHEVIKLVQIPKLPAQLQNVLQKREELVKQIEELKHGRDEIDKEIDKKVYKLYRLREEEIKIVKGGDQKSEWGKKDFRI